MPSLTPSADKVYALAAGELGYTEGSNNYNKYAPVVGVPNNEAWCTTFASWCFKEAGFQSLCLMSDYSVDQLNWFSNRGRASAYPAVGAVVWYGPGGGNHTGIVYAYDADYIYTIEGNFGNKVGKWKRARRSVSEPSIGEPYMYGYPNYPEGIVSADPSSSVAGSRYQATGTVNTAAPVTPTPVDPPPVVPVTPPVHLPYLGLRLLLRKDWHEVALFQDALVMAEGLKNYRKGHYDTPTRDACRSFQYAQGWTGADADGYPGPETLRLLAAVTLLFKPAP